MNLELIICFFFFPSKDLNRESDQLSADVQDLERWRDRILNDIFDGSVRDTSVGAFFVYEFG